MTCFLFIYSKSILIKIIQTILINNNYLYIIIFKYKLIILNSIILKSIIFYSILSKSIIFKANPNTRKFGVTDTNFNKYRKKTISASKSLFILI